MRGNLMEGEPDPTCGALKISETRKKIKKSNPDFSCHHNKLLAIQGPDNWSDEKVREQKIVR